MEPTASPSAPSPQGEGGRESAPRWRRAVDGRCVVATEVSDPAAEQWLLGSRSPTVSTLSGSAAGSEGSADDSEDDDFGAISGFHSEAVPVDAAGASSPSAPRSSGEVEGGSTQHRRLLGVGALAALTVVAGCACQAPYEVLNSRDKGCAHLVSLTEHVFGVVASLGALRKPRQLSWGLHVSLAAASLSYTLLLNVALTSALPTVVLITLKNGNLAANMLLGACVLRRRYSRRECAAVLCVSAGLVVTSLSGGMQPAPGTSAAGSAARWSSALGLVCLAGALLSRAAGATLQELFCSGRGVPVAELLLFRCALGLPAILLQWSHIAEHAERWSAETAVAGVAWPGMWLLLLANITFDYATKVCISHLIDQSSALAATLVLTAQRFVAFVVSATILGGSPAGWDLWFGALAVLVGTLLYTAAQETTKPPATKPKEG